MDNQSTQQENAIVRIGNYLTRLSQKYMPDPTIFAILLTALAYVITLIFTNNSPVEVLNFWYQGFWELLEFAMQMALVVITGGAVGETKIVKRAILKVAEIPKNGKQAGLLVTFVSILLSYIHYGLAIVIASLLAKEIGIKYFKEEKPVSYGLLGAAAYSGMGTWGLGLSTSIGLTIATPGHFLQEQMGIIPFNEFIFHPINIVTAVLSLIILPIFVYFIHPRGDKISQPAYIANLFEREIKQRSEVHELDEEESEFSVGDKLNNSNIIGMGVGLIGLGYIAYLFIANGFSAFNLNSLNGIFLFLGIFLHRNISDYISAFGKSTSNASGIIFQFPLYAGIMGIIQYSGMVNLLAEGIVSISTPLTFMMIMLLVAAIVNMFVPSGGGQWAVQGPIAVQAANIMGQNVLTTSLMVAFGNSLTNLAQPFWALSVLGVTGLKAKDIMGYSMTIMLALTVIMFGTVFIFSL